jgi:hypothetical protein
MRLIEIKKAGTKADWQIVSTANCQIYFRSAQSGYFSAHDRQSVSASSE